MAESTLLESVVSQESAIRRGWLPIKTAADEIVAFERRFGEIHLQLACHAAFPWIVNPELVNLIRINFLDGLDVPWIADADFLLSRLCRPVGGGYYEVDPRIREVLLVELEDTHGPGRLTELAEFLHGYTTTPIAASQPPGTTQMQRWIALAYLEPEQLVAEMTATVHQSMAIGSAEGQMAGQLPVAMTSEIVADPLMQALPPDEYRDHHAFWRTIAYYWHGDQREAFRRGLPAAPAVVPDGDELSEGGKQLALFIDWARVSGAEATVEPASEQSVEPTGMPAETLDEPLAPPLGTKNQRDSAYPNLIASPKYAELEIGLERQDADSFAVDLRFALPHIEADRRDMAENISIAIDELHQLADDPAAYGRRLGQDFFAFPGVREALAVVQSIGLDLRFRLSISPNDRDLQGLHWETLADPDAPSPGAPLLMSERVLFSRYVASKDWRSVTPRGKGKLRALVVVANPGNLDRWRLAPVDVPGEITRAREGMSGIPTIDVLGGSDRASRKNIVERLRMGPDILYLVCHGGLVDGRSTLWLENDDGTADLRDGQELVSWLRELKQPPRLVILVASQSAGTGASPAAGATATARNETWTALGPRLGASGVAAVVVMQGNVSLRTIESFMPVFFRELQIDGIVDRAMAVARGAVRDRPDAWAPVLYMRLKSGRLWSQSGFSVDGAGRRFERWPFLLNQIENGNCTPILGPDFAEHLVVSRSDLALSWADAYQFPMNPGDRADFPKVAQFVYVNQKDRQLLLDELRDSVQAGLLAQLGSDIPEELRTANIDTLLLELARRRWSADSDEPHWVLASAPFPVFVTTAFDRLLVEALKAVGKEPREELFPWNEDAEWPPLLSDTEPTYVPSAAQPLVYYLFGRLDIEDSLVLTEDDYMDFLVGTARNRELFSAEVRARFAETSLLFLGLQTRDLQVLFRTAFSRSATALGRRRKIVHVMQQDEPEEGRLIEIERAREYLQSYYQESNIQIYWGSVQDFTRDLRQQRGKQS